MVDCFKALCSCLQRRAKTFPPHLRAMETRKFKRRKHKRRLSSSFDLLGSSFAAMEVSNQFKQVFKVIDANGDGKISTHELSDTLLSLGLEESKATREAEVMVREMDCNGDGFIDMDEFIDAMNNDGKLGSDSKEEDYLMDAFLIFDTDKNGLISAKELQNVLASLGCNECSLQECRQMIKGVDKDGDGFVDFEEFRSMMTGGLS